MDWAAVAGFFGIPLLLVIGALWARRAWQFDANPKRGRKAAEVLLTISLLLLPAMFLNLTRWRLPYDLPHVIWGFCVLWSSIEFKQSVRNR
ncbi:MAG TPA: hypothetical protein VMI31_17655 [Fimbriimonadaceae bacterium]|nr:hypothetical protein [Fimbriimonadaceae bacterium]